MSENKKGKSWKIKTYDEKEKPQIVKQKWNMQRKKTTFILVKSRKYPAWYFRDFLKKNKISLKENVT